MQVSFFTLDIQLKNTLHRLIVEDTGTPEKNTMHVLNRVTNKISRAVEVSANMATLAILCIILVYIVQHNSHHVLFPMYLFLKQLLT